MSNKVRYSINGLNFESFGIYVEQSTGLGDVLKQKKLNSYSWAEYHGESVDLENIVFEAREIELKCWMKGDDWQLLFVKFREFMESTLERKGTQRLMVEPFDFKPLVYEVYAKEGVTLNKRFADHTNVATFTLKMVEPSPVKKVFFLPDTTNILNLDFSTSKFVEIFFGDGTKYIGMGDISLARNYGENFVVGDGYSIAKTATENPEYYEIPNATNNKKLYQFSAKATIPSGKTSIMYIVGRNNVTGVYEYISESALYPSGNVEFKVFERVNIANYGKFIFKIQDENDVTIDVPITDVRVEQVEYETYWQDLSGKPKYIIIAGDIDEIENLTTNAQELWSRL